MQKAVQCKVTGMTCGNCALTISNFLNKNGADTVVANPTTGDVSFVVDDETRVEKLFDGIDSLGFTVLRHADQSAHHDHQHSKVMPLLLFSLIGWLPLMAHMFVLWAWLHHPLTQFLLCLPVYLIGVFHFGKSAFRSLKNGIPNMDVLVFAGSSAAFFYSLAGWYLHPEAIHHYLFFETTASIITLVLAGNFLEEYTVRSTASSITELMKFQRTKARLILTDSIGKETQVTVDYNEIKINDLLQVNTGDKIPADGIVLSGSASIDESMMSGESLPAERSSGDSLIGGTIVTEGNIRMKATAVGKSTVLANMIRLVDQAQAAKPPLQKLADRIAAVFVPLVAAIAVLSFLLNFYAGDISLANSLMRSIAVLVIACPCAMGLATPAAVMVGLGRAARMGILVRGGDTLEKFKDIRQFVFDKTGTLSTGKLRIGKFESSIDEALFKQLVFSIEQYSDHPIAKSICAAWSGTTAIPLQQTQERKGEGILALDHEGNEWKLGSYRILEVPVEGTRHDLYLLKNRMPVGYIDLYDEVRPDAAATVAKLKAMGYKTILLSGDRQEKCEQIAAALGIDQVFAEQLPEQKMQVLSQLNHSGKIAMVGDGINDAPALSAAHIGISLSDASQIAVQSAQVVLLHNKLSLLPEAITLGKLTFSTIRQNLFWAFFYNIVAIPVAAMGLLTPTWGAGIMALSDVVLILNSLRLRYRRIG